MTTVIDRINLSSNLVLSLEELNSRIEFSNFWVFMPIDDNCNSNVVCTCNAHCDRNVCDCNVQCDGNFCAWKLF